METPKKFLNNPSDPKPDISKTAMEQKSNHRLSIAWKLIFRTLILGVIALAILGYIGIKTYGFTKHVVDNWNEIQFAYTKPEFVKVIRLEYQNEQSAVDQKFLKLQPTVATVSATQTKPVSFR
jgi:hypothetical protein